MSATKLINVASKGRQHVDRYELVGEIASGGMATVYLARLTGVGGFQRLFALKRLHPHLAADGEFVEMFLDEARLAAGIHHPNVVPIIEVGASDLGYYLVMEYIEGDTLARILARVVAGKQRMPGPIVVRIVLDMLNGLHAAHELRDENGELYGLVHRDVSPQNVLVGLDGVSRITDFGVARATARLSASRVGQLKGKIAYMSPEQASGSQDIDRRADIFSAGVLLWECLAARRLFKASNEAATLSRVMSGPIPELAEVCPGIHAGLNQVVATALQRVPGQRYATAAEFADALEQTVGGNLASSKDLASYVDDVLGTEIRLQQRAVREWLQQNEVEAGPSSRTPASLRQSLNITTPASTAAVSVSAPRVTTEARPARVNEPVRRSVSRASVFIGLLVVGSALAAALLILRSGGTSGAEVDLHAPGLTAQASPPPVAAPVPEASPTVPTAGTATAPTGVQALPTATPEPPPGPKASQYRPRLTPHPPKKVRKDDGIDLSNPYR